MTAESSPSLSLFAHFFDFAMLPTFLAVSQRATSSRELDAARSRVAVVLFVVFVFVVFVVVIFCAGATAEYGGKVFLIYVRLD